MRNLLRRFYLWLGAVFWSRRYSLTSIIASSFALQMIACAYGTEDFDCYDAKRFLDIGTISMSKIDSVQIFLNDRRVCGGEMSSKKMIACRVSGASYLEWMSDGDTDNCEVSEEYPMWMAFNCYVGGPSDSIDVSSSKLSMNVFADGQETKVETNLTIEGGTHITIVPEQDTTKWFSYGDSPMVPASDMYRFPSGSYRMGCFNGYCVTSREEHREYCVEK